MRRREGRAFGGILVKGTFTVALMVGDTTLGRLVANFGYDALMHPDPLCIGVMVRARTKV